MSEKEVILVSEEDARFIGQVLASGPGEKILVILRQIFGSRLSYTRGEPEHTAFLEGQKSVIQFVENTVKVVKKAEDKV